MKVDRSGQECHVIPEKVDKDTSWKDNIYKKCLEILQSGEEPDTEVFIFQRPCSGWIHFFTLMQTRKVPDKGLFLYFPL